MQDPIFIIDAVALWVSKSGFKTFIFQILDIGFNPKELL